MTKRTTTPTFEESLADAMGRLHAPALKLTRNPQDAEDLVQEAAMKAYRYRDRFREGTNFRGWLYTIMKNIFINKYRRDKKAPRLVDIEDVRERLGGPGDPEAELADASLSGDLEAAIRTLPEEYRSVLLLSDLHDLRYREIAAILDVPVGTVMSRLYRARRMVERALYDFALRNGYLRGHRPRRFRDRQLMAECA